MENYTIKKSSVVDVNELKGFYKTAYFSRGEVFYETLIGFIKQILVMKRLYSYLYKR